MGIVHVAHVETGPVAAETAGTERRKAALVSQLGQRVGLVHELRELVTAEELLDRGLHRADVDQRRGRGLIGVDDRHPLADHALHPHHADSELVLQLLADGADPTVAKVVDIVVALDAVVDRHLGEDDRQQVAHPERLLARLVGLGAVGVEAERVTALGDLFVHRAQPRVDLVSADAAQVVAARIEELALEHRTGGFDRGRVARAQPLVDLEHRPLLVAFVGGDAGRLFLERGSQELVLRVLKVDPAEHLQDPLVRAELRLELLALLNVAVLIELRVVGVVERAQQRGHCDLALAVDLDREHVAVGGLELEPSPARGDQLGCAERAARSGVDRGAKVDAG